MNWEDIDPEKLAAEILADPVRKWNNRTLPQLGALTAEKDDPNVLFRHNWLGRGQAFGLVASAGVGKSSMADQMALHWAIGKGFLAEPLRPLKIAIIQAEDSDRDLQEQRDGMIKGLFSEGLSTNQVDEAMARVWFPTDFIGLYGDDFLGRLADYQHDHNCDMLFINPLQRFFGKDVSSQEDASQFCAGLDKILKSPETPCAMGIVMHTPKFHSGVKDGRQSVDDFAEYAMAGSQEWTAWVRAVINFQKHGTSEEYFDVKASKRGKRLGWVDADGNPITKRIFKHSDGFIYWQEVTDPDEIAAIPEQIVKPVKVEFNIKGCALQCARMLAEKYGIGTPDPYALSRMTDALYDVINPTHQRGKPSHANAEAVIAEICADETGEVYGVRVVPHPKYDHASTLQLEADYE